MKGLFDKAAVLGEYFLDKLFELESLDNVIAIRGYGLMGGFDLKAKEAPGAYGTALQKKLFWNGLHVKFTGDTGILAPQFIATRENVDDMMAILRETLTD